MLAHRVPKVLQMVTISGFLTRKDLYRLCIIFQNLNMKTSLKWKINLIWPYYDLQICPMKSKKGTKISWDCPFKCCGFRLLFLDTISGLSKFGYNCLLQTYFCSYTGTVLYADRVIHIDPKSPFLCIDYSWLHKKTNFAICPRKWPRPCPDLDRSRICTTAILLFNTVLCRLACNETRILRFFLFLQSLEKHPKDNLLVHEYEYA
jgi:hypothetical protein